MPKIDPSTTTWELFSMSNSSDFFVGILGDGQLARMMCQEAHKLNIRTSVLTTSLKNPACLVNADNFLVNEISYKTILDFAKYALLQSPKAVLTIESEFINPDFLEKVQAETKISIYPDVENLKKIRDRKPQKEFLSENNIATSPCYDFSDLAELEKHLSEKPVVLKKRLFGYDGYGTVILNNIHDLDKIKSIMTSQNDSKESGFNFNAEEWIAEDLIDFKRELAVSFARNQNEQISIFPWVETYQKDSKCLWVKGPMSLTSAMKSLQKEISTALDKINFIGFVTFEVFETKLGELLINEIAPRVHNSAHYSLEALYLNQFKAHLLAVLNLDLPQTPKLISPFAMYNLIASKEINAPEVPITSDQYFLNWYQKNQSRPGRKMGHITCLASTFEEALVVLKKHAKDFDL
jgi:5-(carboxyamino)imidazole ribonucleotide synthase